MTYGQENLLLVLDGILASIALHIEIRVAVI